MFAAPNEKDCLEIETDRGIILRCSDDHPIAACHIGRALRQTINGKRFRIKQYEFIEAKDLVIGDKVAIINDIPIWGAVKMDNPYLIGMLIGDGSYGRGKGVHLYSCDPDT